MADESIIRDSNGKPTHIRSTSDNGRKSTLYEYDDSVAAELPFGSHKGAPVEISEHNPDGTTVAYEYDDGLLANLPFGSHKGAPK